MGLPKDPFFQLLVESFYSGPESGRRGVTHVRPVGGQGVDTHLYVESPREMREAFPVNSMFIVTAKYSNRKGGNTYLKVPHQWGYTKVTTAQAKRFLATREVPSQRAKTD